VGHGYATLVPNNSYVLGTGEIGYQYSGAFYAIPTAQLGNVARVDSYYGNDSTAYVGGLPFLTIQGAINAINAGSLSGVTIWVLPGTYNISPTGTNSTITDSKGQTCYPLIVLPNNTSIRGLSLQTTTIQCASPTQNTILMTVGVGCRIEDLTLTLGSASYAGTYNLVGLYMSGSTTAQTKLRTSVITVNNSAVAYTASTNVYGAQCDGSSGGLSAGSFAFNVFKGSTINVYSNGGGVKRGVIVTNVNAASCRDLNVYVARPTTATGSTGTYVCVETNDTNQTGSIQLRSTTCGTQQPGPGHTYTASDILQTTPTTILDPTYLASAGIQVGPGVDLVTKTAGGKGFSSYVYPTTLFYGALGTLNTSGNPGTGTPAYLWPGTVTVNDGGGQFIQYPDITSPPARYRIQQPLILVGMNVAANTGPGTGHTTTVTVRKTPVGGTIADTVYSLGFTGPTTSVSKYDASVNFAPGDFLHTQVSYDAAGNATQDLAIQLDLF
jgi:hypothetical protein